MDSKQNLTPELKEIYDRVMNTSAGAGAPITPASAAPPPPVAPPMQNPSSALSPPPPAVPPMQNPTLGALNPTEPIADPSEYLSSTQPRPLQDIGTKPFAFSGKVVTATTADEGKKDPAQPGMTPAPAPQAPTSKKGLSLPVVVILFVLFAGVWTLFWLVLLGFIQL